MSYPFRFVSNSAIESRPHGRHFTIGSISGLEESTDIGARLLLLFLRYGILEVKNHCITIKLRELVDRALIGGRQAKNGTAQVLRMVVENHAHRHSMARFKPGFKNM